MSRRDCLPRRQREELPAERQQEDLSFVDRLRRRRGNPQERSPREGTLGLGGYTLLILRIKPEKSLKEYRITKIRTMVDLDQTGRTEYTWLLACLKLISNLPRKEQITCKYLRDCDGSRYSLVPELISS
ncbi:UNVERIFIED_CONTAM: hypothetical protein FKN15_045456 [Acipenser sinensis]